MALIKQYKETILFCTNFVTSRNDDNYYLLYTERNSETHFYSCDFFLNWRITFFLPNIEFEYDLNL